MDKNKNHSSLAGAAVLTTALVGITFWGMLFKGAHEVEKAKEYFKPTNAHLKYINKDSLPDLVYKTGEIYLQTKQGNFVSYNQVLEQEKAKLDSIYQIKQDSLKKIFENKLEKRVKWNDKRNTKSKRCRINH